MNTYEVNVNTGYGIDGGFYSFAWATEAPIQEGWYWVLNENKEIEIVQVYKLGDNFYAWKISDEADHELKEFIMWLGPIPYPGKPE